MAKNTFNKRRIWRQYQNREYQLKGLQGKRVRVRSGKKENKAFKHYQKGKSDGLSTS